MNAREDAVVTRPTIAAGRLLRLLNATTSRVATSNGVVKRSLLAAAVKFMVLVGVLNE